MRVKLDARKTSGNRTSWYRKVSGVDVTKTNGYAFEGEFLPIEKEIDIEEGAILIEKEPLGSVKHPRASATVYRVENSTLVALKEYDDWYKDFLSFRDYVASLLDMQPEPNLLAGFSNEAILAEYRRRFEAE